VEYIIGSPGSEWPPLWEALSRRRAEGEPARPIINCRHGGPGGRGCGGYHRATRKLPAGDTAHDLGWPQLRYHSEVRCTTAHRLLVVAGESISYGDGDAPTRAPSGCGLSEIRRADPSAAP